MTAVLATLAFSLPGLWARLYTLGLPQDERGQRVLKVDSDVFEQRLEASQHGRSSFALLETLVCVVNSIWADLTWRFDRGHRLRVAAIHAGKPRFPGMVTALLGVAGITAAARLSVFHRIPEAEETALTLALLVGPLVGVLGVLIARHSLGTGLAALVAGCGALGVAAWSTVIAPIAALVAFAVGLCSIFETRNASRESLAPGRSAAPTSPVSPLADDQEVIMDTPGKLERWLSLGALAFVASLICWIWFQASYPHAPDTDAEIINGYADANEASAYAAFLAAMLGSLGLLVFFGGIYASMRRAEGGSGYLSAIMLVGAGATAILWMVLMAVTTSTAMAYYYEDEFKAAGVDPQTVRLLDVVGFTLASMAWGALALAMAALAFVALRTHAVLARWLAWATLAIAVLLLFSFPLWFLPTTVVPLWLLATAGWRLASGRGPIAASTTGTRPATA